MIINYSSRGSDGGCKLKLRRNLKTVHWLRHTGISDDVKIRPREHVREDAFWCYY